MPEHSKILIVEDEFILAQDIKNRLIALNYEVVGLCSNGEDAIEQTIQNNPDLVLMDIRLEGEKDGIETADQIQKEMDIPVVFLSAYADKETVKRARMSEPMGYLIKPVEEKELETTIEMALYKHQITRRMRENEKWLATTLSHVGDAVIRTDSDKCVILLNPTAENLTGWSEEDIKGRKLDDVLKLMDEESGVEIDNPIYRKLGESQPAITQPRFLMRRKDGKTTPVDFSSTPIKDESGELIGLVVVLHDITERRHTELTIERRLQLERALDEIAGIFLRNTNPDFDQILERIGNAMKADQGFLYEFNEEDDNQNKYEWRRLAQDSTPGTVNGDHVIASDWLKERLKDRESIIIVEDSSEEQLTEPEKEILNAQQAKAFQAVPLMNGNETLVGVIGFSSGRADVIWSDQDLQVLRVVSEMITTFKARQKAEEEVKNSEIRFRSLIQNSSDLISVIDREGKFLYQSPSSERILGYQPEELIEQYVYALIHPRERETVKERIAQVSSDGNEQLTLEFRIKHKNGSWRDLEAMGKSMLYGNSEAIVINSRDITERKKADQELVKAKEKAEEMNRLKTTFLANMSHEIRTPLTGILGYASIMQTDLEEEGDREMARRIHDSGKRLLATIDAILDLAKIEADKIDVQLQVLDLNEELRNSVELLVPLAGQRNLDLKFEPGEELYAKLDPQFFSQVMNNLIGNALKYTHEGEVNVKLERGVLQKENDAKETAVIHVEDTGVGISDDFVEKIFDEFEQESVGLSRKFEGAGLGLTITRRLVEMMDGQVRVKSEKGIGSTFSVIFPIADPTESDEYYEEIDNQETQDIKSYGNGEKPKVLLVEDNEDSQIVTKNYLNGNFAIDSAINGEEALRHLDTKTYDLILMDINLGDGIDGIQALNEIRNSKKHKETPVVAITAYAMKEDEKYYRNQGFDEYISKPFSKEDIYDAINKILK
ncbi:MAG: PAS domain S-box protein [Balneolales bacterium]